MALGARAEQVSSLVMVQGVAPVIAGLVIGVGRGRRRSLSEFRAEDAEAEAHGFWAHEAVKLLVRREPEKAWSMILRLIELSPDDYVLARVAAGPLEDLLGLHSYAFIDRVEIQARKNPKFRRCLSGVWGWSSIPEDVQVRMRRTWEGEDPL